MEEKMANKQVEIFLGASSLRTALGNKMETLDAMRRGVCGLKYEEAFGMYAGRSEVANIEGYSRFGRRSTPMERQEQI